MRSAKGSRKIIVNKAEYRWRATGNDGYAHISIWPANNVGALILSAASYDETWIPRSDGSSSSALDQIIVTSRLIRRIIELAIEKHGYDPDVKRGELRVCFGQIESADAVRASKGTPK